MQLVLEQLNGNILIPSQPGQGTGQLPSGPAGAVAQAQGGFVTMDKTDVLQTNYSELLSTNITPIMSSVEAWLRPLLIDSAGFVTCVRV